MFLGNIDNLLILSCLGAGQIAFYPLRCYTFTRYHQKGADCVMDYQEITRQARQAAEELLAAAKLQKGDVLVVGCSSSEVGGQRIGTGSSMEIAAALKIPKRWRKCAEFVIREHMRASLVKSPAKIRDLVRALENGHISRRDFEIVVAADNAGKIPDWLARYDEYLAVLKSAAAAPIPERLRGAQIGEHIRSREAQALKEFMMNEKTDKRGGGR